MVRDLHRGGYETNALPQEYHEIETAVGREWAIFALSAIQHRIDVLRGRETRRPLYQGETLELASLGPALDLIASMIPSGTRQSEPQTGDHSTRGSAGDVDRRTPVVG